MSVIAAFCGTHCKAEPLIEKLASITGFALLDDDFVVGRANQFSGLGESKIKKAFSVKTSVFNKFTHEKERSVAYLRLAVAETIKERDNFILKGFTAQLVPPSISHVLRLCIIADMKSRLATAAGQLGCSEKEALKIVRGEDEDRAAWVEMLWRNKDPWDPSLYDMVLPTDKATIDELVQLIWQNLSKDVLKAGPSSRKAVEDFLLAAQVEVSLAQEGHNVEVMARDGRVTLTIQKHVLMLNRLEEELKSIAERVPGVQSVETRVGEGFYQTDIYRKFDFQAPSKVLLVDDEREFVQTLSERLLMRDMGSAVAYDGESALELIREDEPEVMILDLKMPGIDGIEVLRRVKESRPDIEVIILTGHGTEKDRKVCMELGAFAYLQKPVDIELLTQTLKMANEKIRKRQAL